MAVLATAAAGFALLGVWFSGAALPAVLRDPGAVVRWGLPVTTTLTELAGSVALGALLLAVGVLPRRSAGSGTSRAGGPSRSRPAGHATRPSTVRGDAAGLGTRDARETREARGSRGARETGNGRGIADGRAYPRSLVVASVAAGMWTVLSIVHLVLTYASVAGRPLDSATFGQELGLFVTQISLGRTLLLITTIAAVVTALAMAVTGPTGAAWSAALVLVALWQQGQQGHAAGAAGHDLATSAMAVHLVGAAVWIGGLGALALLVGVLGTDLSAAVSRYSVVAGWCLPAVAVSGLVNGLIRTSGWADLGTRYGMLLLAKGVLLVVLGGLGLLHRRRAIPRLTGGRAASPLVPRAGGWLFWRLVAVELAVMGAVSGVAVALGETSPPVPEEAPPDPSPAYQLTGHPLPPPLSAARWFTEWSWDLLLASAAVAGVVVYVRWAWRLHRRGDSWPWARTLSWCTGMALFFWTTSGGPARYGHLMFSAHMVEHMVLAMVVPVFVALSAPVTLALRALPVRASVLRGDESRGPREWILIVVHSRLGQFLAHPVVAAVNFVGSMILFYYSGLFEWSLRSPVGHLAMVVHFSLVGYLFVNAMAGLDPGPRRLGYPQRLLTLFATMAFHAFFGVALVTGDTLLVADWFGLMGRPWGPSALADQQAGGAITWGIGELPTLALAVGVAYAWARDDDRAARRRDRRVDREGDTEMDAYNAMLAGLAERDRTAQPDA